MTKPAIALAACVASGLALYCGSAAALLPGSVESGLQALGVVDLDGRTGPGPAASNRIDEVVVPPAFTRSMVSVADAQPGVFSYSASSDIGALALRLDATMSNNSAGTYFGQGLPVLLVSAQAKDVVTLQSTLPGSFDVSLELVSSGSISTTGAAPRLAPFANALIQLGEAGGTSSSAGARYDVGDISDTLRVTKSFSGASVDVTIDALLSFGIYDLAPGASATGELGNTSFVRLVLPAQGVSISGSESGTFGISIPVPEPQTYAMMLAGLAVVGGWARRRARRTA
jgi:hypothetical protein